jgi:DNA-binding transcriptional MerR regulator
MLDDQLLISELAERAGVSVRTIRFYISEGLLPSPQAHGRYSLYDEEYLTRIELIKLLKNAFLPLKEIKRMVESLSKEEIEHMLHKLNEPTGAPASSPASPQDPAPVAKSSSSTGQVKEGGLPEALNYISRVLKSQTAQVSGRVPPLPAATPPIPGRAGLPETGAANEVTADVPVGAAAALPEAEESSWRRYTIQPGVELLVSEQVYNRSAPAMHRIVAQVKQLFSSHPSGGKHA